MARIQILELPQGAADERPPFVIIIDQAPTDEPYLEAFRRDLSEGNIATRAGARAVLVFEETIDVPANELLPTPATEQGIPPGSTYQMVVDGVPLVWEAPQDEPGESTSITAAARIVGPVRQTINGPVPAKDISTGQVGELYIGGVQLDAKIREVVREVTDKVTQWRVDD